MATQPQDTGQFGRLLVESNVISQEQLDEAIHKQQTTMQNKRLGEVMVRHLQGAWVPTARSPLRDLSPWPMVVKLGDGSAWDTIGKVYKRLELGDAEFLPAFFEWAARRGGGARG